MASPQYWRSPERVGSPLPNFPPLPTNIPVTRGGSGKSSVVNRVSFAQLPQDASPPKTTGAQAAQPSRKPPAPTEQPQKICECCELPQSRVWNCSYCDMNFCDECWGKQGPHKPGRTGPDGHPHEKGDPNIVKRLKNILTPPNDVGEQQQLHIDDEDTTWFGIARDDNNQPIFQDYGRYATIMTDSTTGNYKLRYPQLISFIGQTGAGKSTLVKMLIDQQERRHESLRSVRFPSPVVGSVRNENIPTSGDVHLYGDPYSYYREAPLLYADCEGLEGGENVPMSAQYCGGVAVHKEKEKRQTQGGKRHKISKAARGKSRNIKWADSPERSKRQYAVTELYPRLLYTFSDVIVFVLRNPKYVQSHLGMFRIPGC